MDDDSRLVERFRTRPPNHGEDLVTRVHCSLAPDRDDAYEVVGDRITAKSGAWLQEWFVYDPGSPITIIDRPLALSFGLLDSNLPTSWCNLTGKRREGKRGTVRVRLGSFWFTLPCIALVKKLGENLLSDSQIKEKYEIRHFRNRLSVHVPPPER